MSEEGIQRTLGQIEGKLDSILERLKSQDKKEETQDQRIGSLEKWRSGLAGAWAAVILVATALWDITHGK